MRTVEQIATEVEFYDLMGSSGGDIVYPEACEPGGVYWGTAERGVVSEIATCISKSYGLTVFEGISYEDGWRITAAYHTNDNPHYAGYVPYTRIGTDPHAGLPINESDRISWYQDLLADLYETRLEWLQDRRMPERFRRLPAHAYSIHDDKSALQRLQSTATRLYLTH